MSEENAVIEVKKKQGRPLGLSPSKAVNSPKETPLITEEGDYLVIRISKKAAAKLLLKELF